MTTAVQNPSEYRDLPIDWLVESPTNPRRTFDEKGMQELADSIRANGVLQPLLVRPQDEARFEIVFGARRYRGAKLAERETVPVCIRNLTDAEVLEAQLVENLQRRDVHPLDEAPGFAALLRLEEPKYSIELIAAKCGKSAGYVASRLRLTELVPAVIETFQQDEIGVGHALLLAKLQSAQQEQALGACFQESYGMGAQPKRILLPVRHLQQWIEHNILLELTKAPFSKEDARLLPEAGPCAQCPKRTGHNMLLFDGMTRHDSCSDPACYAAKLDAHVKQALAAKPKLVQISTSYARPKEGSSVVPRTGYVEIRTDKAQRTEQRDGPEYKSCKSTTDAIVAEGNEKGELRRVCADPECPVHHPKKQAQRAQSDAAFKAQQEKQRREETIARVSGMKVLSAIVEAVPVRLMKRDLLFIAVRLIALLDERRLAILIRHHGIGKAKGESTPAKLLVTFLQKADEGSLGRILVEAAILLSARTEADAGRALKEAAKAYSVDIEAISAKARQEIEAKAKSPRNPPTKAPRKSAKKSTA